MLVLAMTMLGAAELDHAYNCSSQIYISHSRGTCCKSTGQRRSQGIIRRKPLGGMSVRMERRRGCSSLG
jgi:hypothetical protein